MSTKNDILAVLENERERFLSGQELAERLGISRQAVWKAVKSLKESGHSILAVTNKGYKLDAGSDLLSSEGLRANLAQKYKDIPITVLSVTDSTNTQAKKLAADKAPHGTLLLAEEQTAGRGRSGKSFFSPRGDGLYMSVVLKPRAGMDSPQMITVAAAVAVCEAIEKLSGLEPQIKWVNDVYLNGKKICGILSEAVTDFESGGIESIVVGVGVDCSIKQESLPTELHGIVGSLGGTVSRSRLAARIAEGILESFDDLKSEKLMNEYRKRSLMQGKKITFTRGNESLCATVTGISDCGALLVRLDNGANEVLTSGEVTLTNYQKE